MTVIMRDKSCFWIFEVVPSFIFCNIPIKQIYKMCIILASITVAEPKFYSIKFLIRLKAFINDNHNNILFVLWLEVGLALTMTEWLTDLSIDWFIEWSIYWLIVWLKMLCITITKSVRKRAIKSIMKVTMGTMQDAIVVKYYCSRHHKPASTTLMFPAHPGAPTDATV